MVAIAKANELKMYKVKMNTNTVLILDNQKFKVDPRLLNSNDMAKNGDVNNYQPTALTPDAGSYMYVEYGQVVDVPENVYLEYKDKYCYVTNPKTGDLTAEFEERLANASENERKYLLENQTDLTNVTFHKPFFDLVS